MLLHVPPEQPQEPPLVVIRFRLTSLPPFHRAHAGHEQVGELGLGESPPHPDAANVGSFGHLEPATLPEEIYCVETLPANPGRGADGFVKAYGDLARLEEGVSQAIHVNS